MSPHSSPRSWKRALAAAAASALVLAPVGCTADGGGRQDSRAQQQTSAPAQGQQDTGYADLVEQVEPSVVTVRTGSGLGSGVVLRDNVVVTNQHVVKNQRQVTLVYADGTQSGGRVLATDEVTTSPCSAPSAATCRFRSIGRSCRDRASAHWRSAAPLGFQNSVTAGIISGLHREIPGSAGQTQSLVDLIQTDASISPGNSGGALLDAQGRVIGINEAYIPPSAGAVSLGFAIPSATVLDVADELLKDGTATHAYLGVSLGRITPAIPGQAGTADPNRARSYSASTTAAPPPKQALRRGDVIVRFDDQQIANVEDVLSACGGPSPASNTS
ncbi:S1C family serine protease [Prauserella muralis]|uniref:S1C family serine protease n=1 Tax=Prauserella muralis TaxID=588067 RepID=UPI0011AE1463|nr:trypsin-like peptidase domain-containing protein [Prauserella muralis]TWE27816.1 S1-C subfamily serine protease [Prauserella muralis]